MKISKTQYDLWTKNSQQCFLGGNALNKPGLAIFQIEPNPFIYEYAMNGEWRETYIWLKLFLLLSSYRWLTGIKITFHFGIFASKYIEVDKIFMIFF